MNEYICLFFSTMSHSTTSIGTAFQLSTVREIAPPVERPGVCHTCPIPLLEVDFKFTFRIQWNHYLIVKVEITSDISKFLSFKRRGFTLVFMRIVNSSERRLVLSLSSYSTALARVELWMVYVLSLLWFIPLMWNSRSSEELRPHLINRWGLQTPSLLTVPTSFYYLSS